MKQRQLDSCLILSDDEDSVETAGVGFLVSPTLRRSVASFDQHSERLAVLKLRISVVNSLSVVFMRRTAASPSTASRPL